MIGSTEPKGEGPFGEPFTGVAWPSSARAVRCWVKSRNERNPYRQLLSLAKQSLIGRKEGTTSGHHDPYVQGYTHATMAGTNGSEAARQSQSEKAGLSWDSRLKPACLNVELLVTAGQQYCGEYVPGDCTHRPSSHGSRRHLKSLGQPERGAGAEGGADDWD